MMSHACIYPHPMLTTGYGYHTSFTFSASGWPSSSSYSIQLLNHMHNYSNFYAFFLLSFCQQFLCTYVDVSVTQCNIQSSWSQLISVNGMSEFEQYIITVHNHLVSGQFSALHLCQYHIMVSGLVATTLHIMLTLLHFGKQLLVLLLLVCCSHIRFLCIMICFFAFAVLPSI